MATFSTDMVRNKPESLVDTRENQARNHDWTLTEGFLGRFWAVP